MYKLKMMLNKIIEEESNLEWVETTGKTLDEALENACIDLDSSLSELDYEIIESGDKGIFGMGAKPYRIKVYRAKDTMEMLKSFMSGMNKDDMELQLDLEKEIKNKDGEVFIRVVDSGVWLKISKCVGDGIPVAETEVYNLINYRGFKDYDDKVVRKIIKEASGEYVKIGMMKLNPLNDGSANVQISSDKMKAYLMLMPPKQGGYDLELDQIRSILKNNSVIVGIKEDVLNSLIDYPIYDKPILVAEGLKVQNGRDGLINYNFNTSKKVEFQEHNGQIDYKSINSIQNVVTGQILAIKISPTQGEAGRTVDGEMLYAKPGKDIVLVEGKNTQVSEDGLNIIAATNGQVNLLGTKVNVDEIYVVNGDVNLKIGHITFLGNVVINGNVEDNFNVVAEGNIEIKGSVGKCKLEAEGDIIVSQGIAGKGEATIRAGKSLYAKYIEQVKKIEVAEGVYVQDAIMHSFVDATKEICCVGKRATIVGGDLRAGELIKSLTIGSQSGTETIVEVGIDPKKRQQLVELTVENENAYKQLEQLEINFATLKNQKKQMKDKFPPEKQETYNNLNEEINRYKKVIQKTQDEMSDIDKYLLALKDKGRVVAAKIVYPQVKIYIKSSMLQIRTEYKKVEFVLDNGEVNVVPYKDEKESGSRTR